MKPSCERRFVRCFAANLWNVSSLWLRRSWWNDSAKRRGILVAPSPAATRRDLFVMAAEVEDAVGRQVDFLIRADVEVMKNIEARDLILGTAVTLWPHVP